jgi:hypothetical protein
MAEQQSWQLTARERRTAFTAAAAAFSTVLGPFGPLAVWCLEFVYDRRDLIFSPSGVPVSAYTAGRNAVGLTALTGGIGNPLTARSTLDIDTSLTPSARRLGLRPGDPVSLAVTGHNYARSGSGLVVPARIGERVTLSVPSGSYSVAAFGSKQDNLFRLHDPYNTVAGDNVSAQGYRRIGLPLIARSAPLLLPQATPRPFPAAVVRQPAAPLAARKCPWCGQMLSAPLLVHMQLCSKSPGGTATTPPRAAGLTPFRCDRCYQRFTTAAGRDQHLRDWHPFITWVRDWLG